MVHRDLKPANILVEQNGHVWVIDFGVARILEDMGIESSASLRTLGAIVGTPDYMAPEQFSPREREVDLRADVYGLGAVAYRLLLGRPPHVSHGLSLAQLAVRKESTAAVPLRRLGGRRIRAELSDVVAVALSPRPEDRHESCGELASELRRVLDGLAPRRRSPGLSRRAVLFARRRPEVVVLGGLRVLAAAGPLGHRSRTMGPTCEPLRRASRTEACPRYRRDRDAGILGASSSSVGCELGLRLQFAAAQRDGFDRGELAQRLTTEEFGLVLSWYTAGRPLAPWRVLLRCRASDLSAPDPGATRFGNGSSSLDRTRRGGRARAGTRARACRRGSRAR